MKSMISIMNTNFLTYIVIIIFLFSFVEDIIFKNNKNIKLARRIISFIVLVLLIARLIFL